VRKKSFFTLQLLNVVNEQISKQALMMITLQLSIAVCCQLRLARNSNWSESTHRCLISLIVASVKRSETIFVISLANQMMVLLVFWRQPWSRASSFNFIA